jgi:LPXTG-site transpeptidase (sortase) family protein
VRQTSFRLGLTHNGSDLLVKSFLRTALGILFMLAGCALIMGAGLFTLRLALTGYLAANPTYLTAPTQPAPLIVIAFAEFTDAAADGQTKEQSAALIGAGGGFLDGSLPLSGGPSATPESLQPRLAALPTPTAMPSAGPTATPLNPGFIYPQPTPVSPSSEYLEAKNPPPLPSPTPTVEPVAVVPFPTETPLPEPVFEPTPEPIIEPAPEPAVYTSPDPIVRITIPRLKVKRAVVDIGLVSGQGGVDQWDTDSLFATQSRSDLVGHLEGSPYPGEGGNTVLVGHNYDNVGAGVFVNLHKLAEGDQIKLITESGQEYLYQVVKVKSVAYNGGDQDDLDRHQRFLGLTPDERLTLVTCGGVNIGFYSKRVYVVAVPVQP